MIGIRGAMGAGKDTLAAEIIRHFPQYGARNFAAELRAALSIITGLPAAQTVSAADKRADLSGVPVKAPVLLARVSSAVERVTQRPCGARVAGEIFRALTGTDAGLAGPEVTIPMTVGRLLQVLGTECFRAHVGADVWADALIYAWERDGCPPVVVTDARFPNETAAIRRAGGVVVHVRRSGAGRADGREPAHASERALDSEAADFVLDNDGTVEDLLGAFLAVWPAAKAMSALRAQGRPPLSARRGD